MDSAPIETFPALPSTNAWLLERARASGLVNGSACLADTQTAGRGRRGRHWVSPPGQSLYLSLFWVFSRPAAELAGLGLVAAVVAAEALRTLGVAAVQLKWPNDLVVNEHKLGGILVELVRTGENNQGAVVGVGINGGVDQTGTMSGVDQPWTEWTAWQDPARPVSRTRLAESLIVGLRSACAAYDLHGFSPWIARWESLHRDQGEAVCVEREAGGDPFCGAALGLSPEGGLRLRTGDRERVIFSGDVFRARRVAEPARTVRAEGRA